MRFPLTLTLAPFSQFEKNLFVFIHSASHHVKNFAGRFPTPIPDLEHPESYLTLKQLCALPFAANGVRPDAHQPSINGFVKSLRCPDPKHDFVAGSKAEIERHLRLFHAGQRLLEQLGHTCSFKPQQGDQRCGQTFTTSAELERHRTAAQHKRIAKPRAPRRAAALPSQPLPSPPVSVVAESAAVAVPPVVEADSPASRQCPPTPPLAFSSSSDEEEEAAEEEEEEEEEEEVEEEEEKDRKEAVDDDKVAS